MKNSRLKYNITKERNILIQKHISWNFNKNMRIFEYKQILN